MLKLSCTIIALLFVAPMSIAMAAPNTNSKGQKCIKTGTERRVGTDQDGNKLDCLFDSCTTCKSVEGKIDCNSLSTEYTNARDCKPVADAGPKTRFLLEKQQLVAPPAVMTTPPPSTAPQKLPPAPNVGGAIMVAPK